MKDFIAAFEKRFDHKWLDTNVLNMYKLERKQTFPYWQKSAQYACDLLKAEGFEAELIDIPADGKTVYQDKCTPIGWDVTKQTLTVVSGVPALNGKVISDFEQEPLMAVKHSVATPPEGITARVVTEGQMKAGEDVRGAFVLLDQTTRPRGENMRMLLDLGALGWISDFLENPGRTPDDVAWINAGTENNSWHVQAEDRPYTSYQITPTSGVALRNACQAGPVKVHAYSDGRRYETTLPVVTGLLRGEDPREVWMVGHLYEPLIDDNTNGVIGSIEILKVLRDMAAAGEIKLKYSVRVIFASEMYGFAAATEYFGGDLNGRVLGAINMDGITGSYDKSVHNEYRAIEAPDLPGFAGNILLHEATDHFSLNHPEMIISREDHGYGDDCAIGDSTIGVPVVWIFHGPKGLHHNSWQNENQYDPEKYYIHLGYCAAWVRAMAALTEDEVKEILPGAAARAQNVIDAAAADSVRVGTDCKARLEFIYERECAKLRALQLWAEIPEIDAAANSLTVPAPANTVVDVVPAVDRPDYARAQTKSWFDYADDFIFGRLTRGFPHDLMKKPFKARNQMPGTILYSTLADVLSRMDGKKTLKTIYSELEWDKNLILDEKTAKEYLMVCTMLSEWGYLSLEQKNVLSAADLTAALKKLGVEEGETLLVHSGLSGLGYLPGGTNTVIDALKAAVGETGTFMAPAFARPYIMFEGSLNKSYRYRPYDTRPDGDLRDRTISTGALPKAMLKYPGSRRSGHSTHEWVAIGADAETCVAGHGLLDSPTGVTSPLDTALKRGGSVVFLGCSIAPNTFLHYLEDVTDAPFMQSAVIRYLDADGEPHTACIPRHLPGDRDFYGDPAGSAFYAEAVERGLKIDAVPFGIGWIYRMELANIYEVGMAMFRDDPVATLCKNPDCAYCASFRSKVK